MDESNNVDNEQHKSSEKGRKWGEKLKFLAAISGFLALLSSAVTFSISNGMQIYKELTWEENLKILKLESVAGYLFVNDGDGEVYVNDVSYYDEDTKNIKVDYVNETLNPGKFLTFRPKRKDLKGFVPLMAAPDRWSQIFYALNKSYPGLSSEYCLPKSDFFKVIEQSAHKNPGNLVKTKGEAIVHYFGTKDASVREKKLKVIGLVWKSNSLKFIPGKKGIDENYNK